MNGSPESPKPIRLLIPTEQPSRWQRTKQRLFSSFAVFSLLLSIAIVVFWFRREIGLSDADHCDGYSFPVVGKYLPHVGFWRGGLMFLLIEEDPSHLADGNERFGYGVQDDDSERLFRSFQYGKGQSVARTLDDKTYRNWQYFLIVPYWFLVLFFVTVHALWVRRRYVQRRDQKFLEEAIASKHGNRTEGN